MEGLIFDIQRFVNIKNDTSNNVIVGTADADDICNWGSNVTINGGALNVNGQAGTFILSGQSFGADYQTKTWYAK